MTVPLHPDLTFNDSRAISEAGRRHTAQVSRLETVRLPNGEYIETWVVGPLLQARMTEIGFRDATIAAAKGVKAQWVVVFKQTADVVLGDRVTVEGRTDGVDWQRIVEITSENWMTGRVHKQTLAVDVDLSGPV